MAPKIERIWGTVFGTPSSVQRKEKAEKDALEGADRQDGNRQQQFQQQSEQDDDAQQKATKAEVEKALADLQNSEHLTEAGLRAEMAQSAQGIEVRILKASGGLVRTMTAEEFLKMRKNTSPTDHGRGKILDQKF